MDHKKFDTIIKLDSLLRTIIDGYIDLSTEINHSTNNLQKIKIQIAGVPEIEINVEGDSPEQIVKDVLNTIWRMR